VIEKKIIGNDLIYITVYNYLQYYKVLSLHQTPFNFPNIFSAISRKHCNQAIVYTNYLSTLQVTGPLTMVHFNFPYCRKCDRLCQSSKSKKQRRSLYSGEYPLLTTYCQIDLNFNRVRCVHVYCCVADINSVRNTITFCEDHSSKEIHTPFIVDNVVDLVLGATWVDIEKLKYRVDSYFNITAFDSLRDKLRYLARGCQRNGWWYYHQRLNILINYSSDELLKKFQYINNILNRLERCNERHFGVTSPYFPVPQLCIC